MKYTLIAILFLAYSTLYIQPYILYIILYLYIIYIDWKEMNDDDTKEPKTYFIMTNEKGDYGCMTFTDYDMYKSSLETYTKLGWID